ncbi:MAG: hypothetical protein ACRECA_02840 [Pseudolabrys sp.]
MAKLRRDPAVLSFFAFPVISVLNKVRSIKHATPDIGFMIFMTGYSRSAIVHQGRLDRGTELISKPLIEGVVARKIRQVLDAAG